MSQERMHMSKLREVLRLHFSCRLSNRKIGRALNISPSTVGYYIKGVKKAALSWQQCQHLDDKELVSQLRVSMVGNLDITPNY
jgi:predicted transcriptional regulator